MDNKGHAPADDSPPMNRLSTLLKKLDAVLLNLAVYLRGMEPITSVPSRFDLFCNLIKNYEGANPANNNPYDFRYYFGGYLPKYGIVKESSGGFAMFETLALGEEYGQTCIREMILNHPNWTFEDFFMRYAPPSDNNNTNLYASTIAAGMGVESTALVKPTINL
jgi:hypothetical protein